VLTSVLLFGIIFACVLLNAGIRLSRRKSRRNFQSLDSLQSVLDAYRRGDYETGLLHTEALKVAGAPNAEYYFYRGKMLYQLGKYKEAESALSESIALEKDKRRMALTREILGSVLVEEERYNEAIECFEASVRLWPDRDCAHQGIAEALLRRGGAASEALARARRAANIDHSSQAMNAEIHNLNWSEALATLAWAVAEHSKDAAEVERLLAEALPLCGNESRPIRAQLHYHAGRAYSALGQMEMSARQFEQAAQIDPHGNYGRLARTRALHMQVA